MEVNFPTNGPPELRREDGWFYRLYGIGFMEMTVDYDHEAVLEVALYDLSDRTLDSIRVVRDSFPHLSIRLNHDY